MSIDYNLSANNTRNFGSTQEELIMDHLNPNLHLAVEAIQKVADAMKFSPKPEEFGWEKYSIDDNASDAVQYVLSIVHTVVGAQNVPLAPITIGYMYDRKLLYFAVGRNGNPYDYAAIRVENGFPLFVAVCSYLKVKPKREHAYSCLDGTPLSIRFASMFKVTIEQKVYSSSKIKAICNDTANLATMSVDALRVHAKDVMQMLAVVKGSKVYPKWIFYACSVYAKIDPGYHQFEGDKRYYYFPTRFDVRTANTHLLGIAGYTVERDTTGRKVLRWNGFVQFVPAAEGDYQKFIEQYPKSKVPELVY